MSLGGGFWRCLRHSFRLYINFACSRWRKRTGDILERLALGLWDEEADKEQEEEEQDDEHDEGVLQQRRLHDTKHPSRVLLSQPQFVTRLQ